MAICKSCGTKNAGFMSDLCGECIVSMHSASASSTATTTGVEIPASSEGETATLIGNSVIWVSLVASILCILLFGRIDVPNMYGGTDRIWSSTLNLAFIAAGLNGMFFGYTLSKIGSVLKHLEAIRGGR